MSSINRKGQDLTVCVTGAAGKIAQSFIPRLLSGQVFGSATKINLRLLDIAPALNVVKGVVMEIKDCAFTLCKAVQFGDDAKSMFKNADVIVFLGGFPRKKGMERKDLLQKNKNIFIEQGQALSYANPNVKCVVVANPANTNATILSRYSKIRPQNITCLTRLDHNRAISQICQKVNVQKKDLSGVVIFGNHSLTQYPSIEYLKIKNKPVSSEIQKQWLQKTFISKVQERGAEIINVKGSSSVFSAASATVDHLRDWYQGTDQIVSMGVVSKGDYGIPVGLWTSLPVRCKNFEYEIVKNLEISDFSKQKIGITVNQLQQQLNDAQINLQQPKPKL